MVCGGGLEDRLNCAFGMLGDAPAASTGTDSRGPPLSLDEEVSVADMATFLRAVAPAIVRDHGEDEVVRRAQVLAETLCEDRTAGALPSVRRSALLAWASVLHWAEGVPAETSRATRPEAVAQDGAWATELEASSALRASLHFARRAAWTVLSEWHHISVRRRWVEEATAWCRRRREALQIAAALGEWRGKAAEQAYRTSLQLLHGSDLPLGWGRCVRPFVEGTAGGCRILRRAVERAQELKGLCRLLEALRGWHGWCFHRTRRRHRLRRYARALRARLGILDAVLAWRLNRRQGTTWRLAIHGGETAIRALRDGIEWGARRASEAAARRFLLVASWWKLWVASEAATARLCGSIVARWRGLEAVPTMVPGQAGAFAAFAPPRPRESPARAWLVN